MRLNPIFLVVAVIFLLNSGATLAVAHFERVHASELTAVDTMLTGQSVIVSSKRFLRTSEEDVSSSEERVLPDTKLAKKMISKLTAALHIKKAIPNNQLARTEGTEKLQFALWFLHGKKPSDVEKILKVSAVHGDGPLHSVLMRYINYFSRWRFRGITFHV